MNNVTQIKTTAEPDLQLAAVLAAAESAPSVAAKLPRSPHGTRVLVETPHTAPSAAAIGLNQIYGREALRDSLLRGEAPMAAQQLYGQTFVLDNDDPTERKIAISAGHSWLPMIDKVVVYTDRGISVEMRETILRAEELGVPVERRSVPGWERG